MKKYISFLLSIIIAATVFTTVAAADVLIQPDSVNVLMSSQQNTTEPVVAVSSVSGKIGDTVTVSVSFKNNPGIAAFRFFVDYEEEYLKATAVRKGDALTSGNLYSNISVDNITVLITQWDNSSNISNDGVVFSIDFYIKKTAFLRKYPITITYNNADLCNDDFQEIMFLTMDGDVDVNGFDLSGNDSDNLSAGDSVCLLPDVENNELLSLINWTTDDETIATVDENGNVIAVSPGTTHITASVTIGDTVYSSSVEITVKEPPAFLLTYINKDDSVAFSEKVNVGLPLTIPEAQNIKGYIFIGWFDSQEKTPAEYAVMPENDLIFTAHYILKGDINFDGFVDIGDAILASRYDAGNKTLTEDQIFAGDVTGDGKVDIGDAVRIARYDADQITEL